MVGTRVPVRSIVLVHRFEPNLAAVGKAYPMLERADIEEALAFYQAHRTEIDHYIAENEMDGDD